MSPRKKATPKAPEVVEAPPLTHSVRVPATVPGKTQAIARVQPAPVVVGPMSVLQRAVSEGASVDTLERLLGMQERWEAMQAKKAFDAAMAAVRAKLPTIMKSREVDFTNKAGQRTHYHYEDLSAITEAIDPVLAEHGLSYRWHTDNNTEPMRVTVTCILSHAQGHSEKTPLSAKHDDTGNKNDIQAIGSAVTYLQRYTLKAALGLAAALDDDGLKARSAARQPEEARQPTHVDPHADQPITVGWKDKATGEKHYGQLERLITIQRKSGRADNEVSMWLKVRYGYDSRKEIKRRDYDAIVAAIEAPGPLPLPREPGGDDE